MLDAKKREALRQARARIAEIMAPQREAARKARKTQRDATKAARKAAPMEDQRRPRVREPLYLAFLRRQPCLGCGKSPCDAAHIRFVPNGSGWRPVGMMEKPDDWRAVPLCREHHRQQHGMNEGRFWSLLGLDPEQEVERLRALFLGNATLLQTAIKPASDGEARQAKPAGDRTKGSYHDH